MSAAQKIDFVDLAVLLCANVGSEASSVLFVLGKRTSAMSADEKLKFVNPVVLVCANFG